ncbi:MAG: HAD-IC family P-type ATPase [Corynebacterium sp.]|nr:HAD-IC family P-type ATPase [Corynebacterium sp.]
MNTTLQGLSAAEAAQRREQGLSNEVSHRSGRSLREILRANVCTRINAMLFVLWCIVIATGSWINSAFGLMIIANSTVGVVQELRAKRTLDKLKILGQTQPTVIRDGKEQHIAQEDIVQGDLIKVGSGDEILVDGSVVSGSFAVDESQLTGEADPIHKEVDDELQSGSFVRTGVGYYRAEAVGDDAYAAQLAAQASEFSLTNSELFNGINTILRVITWLLIPTGILTMYTQLVRSGTALRESILAMAAALVPMIPEGLVLMTSIAFAAGVIRLGRHRALVNELVAIEGLARVNTVCTDKTGTLTTNRLVLVEVFNASGQAADRTELAQLVSAQADRNLTSQALYEALGEPDELLTGTEIPFDSQYKFSGFQTADAVYVLGAPDVVIPQGNRAQDLVLEYESQGYRVLAFQVLASLPESGAPQLDEPQIIVLEQQLRDDAADTLEFFQHEDVEIKVISGDNPTAVEAVARQAGLNQPQAVDARTLNSGNMDTAVSQHNVFGRVSPAQKSQMVDSLHRHNRVVAMTGDGVNDILALKRADIGVAMGDGSPASRAVSQLVLLDNKFSALPHVVAEGRRVIGNIERVAHLFLTKTVYSVVLAAIIAILGISFPFQPIYVTITGWFTIGIPAFILSLAPNYQRPRENFVGRVLGFAMPAGILIGLFSALFWIAAYPGADATEEARREVGTAVLVTLIVMSLWVLCIVVRPWNWWRLGLVLVAASFYLVIFLTPLAELFLLNPSNPRLLLIGLGLGIVGAGCIEGVHRMVQNFMRWKTKIRTPRWWYRWQQWRSRRRSVHHRRRSGKLHLR